jgi:hypothetical protein
VAGLNTSSANRGTVVHAIIVEVCLDLLDFVSSIYGQAYFNAPRPLNPVVNIRSTVDEKVPIQAPRSNAVQTSSRLTTVDEGYVAISQKDLPLPSPSIGLPVREPAVSSIMRP